MADLGVSNPLFVGDSASDVQVAENAGLDSVFLRREHRADYDLPVEPTYELESLVGLRSLLD
jgi:phosphoglycolate phosphatase-like HAD superfamily hydrolase